MLCINNVLFGGIMLKKLLVVLFATLFLLSCGNSEEFSEELNNLSGMEMENGVSLQDSNVSLKNIKVKNNKTVFETSIGYLDRDYSFDFKVNSPYFGDHYYIYEGELPNGLELDEDSGVISGHPLEEGRFDIKLAYKKGENGELNIVPFVVTINTNVVLYKKVNSFVDISLSENSPHRVNHNGVITLTPSTSNSSFFKFFGTDANQLRVCQEGYIIVGNAQCNIAQLLQGGVGIIAPFADTELTMGSDSDIYYQVRGKAPRRMLFIQYKNLHRTTDTNSSHNFEVVIHEDSNDIQFLYGLSYSKVDGNQKHLGSHATIGIISSRGANVLTSRDTPKIFRGTIITYDSRGNTYQSGPNEFSGNVVTDYLDISRPADGAKSCTNNSDCSTGICSSVCRAKNITSRLIYNGSQNINIPFDFNFYGNTYNSIQVHENGYLYFGGTNITNDNVYPARDNPINIRNFGLDNAIVPFFSNIDLKSTRGGNILYNVIGTAPNRKLIIMYDSVRIKDIGHSGVSVVDQMATNSTFLVSFEVVLHETSNIIEFLYGTNNAAELDLQHNFSHLHPTVGNIKEVLRVYSGGISSIGLKKDVTRYVNTSVNQDYIGQGRSITFVPNDATATSYTWVGLGNDKRNNANSSGNATLAGGFTPAPSAWLDADDQPGTNFIRYDRSIVSNQWVNTSSGTTLRLSDDSYRTIGTSRPYKFYGDRYTRFYLQSNGAITLTSGTIGYSDPGTINYAASGSWRPDKGIFPFWNDLNPSRGGYMKYGEFTRGSQKALIVEWHNIPRYYRTGNYRLQAQLYEDGTVYFCYQSIYNDGHVVGIRKNRNEKDGYTGNVQTLVNNHQCIKYTPVYSFPPGHVQATRSTVSGQDDGEQNVSLGFNFDFKGTNYNRITLSSNGRAILENSNSNITYYNRPLSSTNTRSKSLNPFWDDLYPPARNTGHYGVFYKTIGSAPNRQFLLTYNNVAHFSNRSMHVDVQMILQETTNKIFFCYGNMSGGYSDASSATIGVKASNTDYQEFSYNHAQNLQGKCYEWHESTPGFSPTRNLYTGKMNSNFIDIPVVSPLSYGEALESEYTYGNDVKPYAIFDLSQSGVNYPFSFKGVDYNQLFIDSSGSVSFGNDNEAAILTGPFLGNTFTQTDLTQNSNHPALSSPYDNVEANFMWIANAGDNSLSKINTYTGTLMGVYSVGSSPSRTAVGFDGAVWVGNRGSHNVTKLDRNGNFICTVNLNSSCAPRALALDKDENVWVGCKRWSGPTEGWVYKIRHNHSTNTCEILDLRAPGDTSSDKSYKGHTGQGTYGFAIDRNGILWSSGLGSKILRIDTNKRPGDPGFYKRFNTPAGRATYGIAVDGNGVIWHAIWSYRRAGEILIRSTYNEGTGVLTSRVLHSTGNQSYGRGVAIDGDGNVWTASSGWNTVSKFRPDGTFVAHYNLHCSYPIGVGVDQDGDIWGNCYRDGYSSELTRNGVYKRRLYTGRSPYCYSDNTGFNLRNIVAGSKPTKFYAGIVEEQVKNNGVCQYLKRKLVVQWKDVRLKPKVGDPIQDGNTEANFEMIFDNGAIYDCDGTNPRNAHPVKISYVYGAMQGNRVSPKSGGKSGIFMRTNSGGYSHTFSTKGDVGTVNSGSEFLIQSKQ